eukprot:gb/GEZN01006526.1/.p1 GENE.gb/GEZN01006526.1/~~gb/GEZN01006526.1/.p1  ORF type:complete len:498 (-),score=88.20 gb/GEZN01006526.1/:29-1522(-)
MMDDTPVSGIFELKDRLKESILKTNEMFLGHYGLPLPIHKSSNAVRMETKVADEYASVRHLPPPTKSKLQQAKEQSLQVGAAKAIAQPQTTVQNDQAEQTITTVLTGMPAPPQAREDKISELVDQIGREKKQKTSLAGGGALIAISTPDGVSEDWRVRSELIRKKREEKMIRPEWHAPWKLFRVIPGHLGWVRALAVDPANEWFASGAGDRTIKIWDLASGVLKLTLTGHISAVMGLEVSARHPYLFSVSQDKTVRCWDLETNKCIRKYHGHLSGVYAVKLHPTLDILVTAGRDSCARVWDVRTKAQVRVLGGHKGTVAGLITQEGDPQVITGSHDSTIRLWDLAEGTAMATLTNHKKSVRALVQHPKEFTFASASADNMKIWKCPEGKFLRNVSGHNAIVNSLALNRDDVLVSGGDNGSVKFWDWKTGYNFQTLETVVQPGSLDSEAGIFQMTFDVTGSRLITAEADKTIKMYKEDTEATPQTHPVKYKAIKRKRY